MKILFFAAAAALFLGAAGCSDKPGRADPPLPPNIVLVLLDAARADHFSGYGYPRPTTPEIDKLGREGAVFLDNFVPATETFAALPLIMSSRYFSRPIFQMDTWGWGIRRETPETLFRDFDPEQILLPGFLAAAGYRTAIFHNHPWFVDQTVLVRAFGESYFFPTSAKKPFDGVMVKALLDWIREEQSRPFFIYYHVMSPHQPFPPKAEDSRFIDPGEEAALAAAREKFAGPGGSDAANWTEEELYYFRAMYDSNLAYSDRWVGRLYAGLKEMGLAEDTLFIVTSDHGELLGEHGLMTHGDFPPWEGIIHVPLVMAWPGKIPAGVRVAGLTGSVDIFPTIIDLAGLELPSGKSLDGVSLRECFANPEAGREAVYVKNAVRTGDYKYMVDRDLFFDVRDDPGELRNIASSQPPDLKERLKSDYDRFMEPHRELSQRAVRRSPPPEPFYYPVNTFSVTPRSAYRVFGSEKFPDHLLTGPPPEYAWHLNTSDRHGYLFCRPGEEAPPKLRLAAPLIDGEYLVSILVSPLQEGLPFSDDGREFPVSFGDSAHFQSPVGLSVLPAEEGEAPSYYLDYGEVPVREENFTVEFRFRPRPGRPFLIPHIKFASREGRSGEPLGQGELTERVKSLRSLGYVR